MSFCENCECPTCMKRKAKRKEPYDGRPFWEKFDEPKLKEALVEIQQWGKTRGYRPKYYDEVAEAYNRRFGPQETKRGE